MWCPFAKQPRTCTSSSFVLSRSEVHGSPFGSPFRSSALHSYGISASEADLFKTWSSPPDPKSSGTVRKYGVVHSMSSPKAIIDQTWQCPSRHVTCGDEYSHALKTKCDKEKLWTILDFRLYDINVWTKVLNRTFDLGYWNALLYHLYLVFMPQFSGDEVSICKILYAKCKETAHLNGEASSERKGQVRVSFDRDPP